MAEEETLLSKLNIKNINIKELTFLAASLSCWLCVFDLPEKDVDHFHPDTFKQKKKKNLMYKGIFPFTFLTDTGQEYPF